MAVVELGSTSLIGDAALTNYWKLEDLTATVGGNNLSNPTSKSFVAAKFNNGIDMGTTTRNALELNTTASVFPAPTAAYSVSFWFKQNTAVNAGNIDPAIMTGSRDNATGFAINIGPIWNGGSPQIRVFRRTNTDVLDTVTFGNDTTNWHHIVHTYNGTNMINYLDNVAFNAGVATSGSFNSNAYPNLSIGGSYMSNNAMSIIDDFAIFTKALSAAEVDELYNGSASAGSRFLTLLGVG